jgi:hypothetical protein
MLQATQVEQWECQPDQAAVIEQAAVWAQQQAM